jgi:hypothetical protein
VCCWLSHCVSVDFRSTHGTLGGEGIWIISPWPKALFVARKQSRWIARVPPQRGPGPVALLRWPVRVRRNPALRQANGSRARSVARSVGRMSMG